MKTITYILTILLLLMGSAVFAQTGVTVFGDCYVSEKGSVGFFIDKLSLQTDISGEGKVVMAGKNMQIITAAAKKINHLVIDNPTVVRVEGELTVSKTLDIKQGDVAVMPNAQLLLQGAAVNIAKGSHLIHFNVLAKQGTDALPNSPQHLTAVHDGLTNTWIKNDAQTPSTTKATEVRFSLLYHPPYLQNIAPPPRA